MVDWGNENQTLAIEYTGYRIDQIQDIVDEKICFFSAKRSVLSQAVYAGNVIPSRLC
jgi:hypothetical protein